MENITNLDNLPFWLGENALYKDAETVAQDEQRDGDIVFGTVMAYNPTSGQWVPWTDETATDGTQWPAGVCLDTLAEADIQAGDVENVSILVGNCIVPGDELTFENSLTADTIVNEPLNTNKPAWKILSEIGIFIEDTIQTSVGYPD